MVELESTSSLDSYALVRLYDALVRYHNPDATPKGYRFIAGFNEEQLRVNRRTLELRVERLMSDTKGFHQVPHCRKEYFKLLDGRWISIYDAMKLNDSYAQYLKGLTESLGMDWSQECSHRFKSSHDLLHSGFVLMAMGREEGFRALLERINLFEGAIKHYEQAYSNVIPLQKYRQ